MSSHQALYYPFIHFKNDAWVKLAALYWDRLGRIVPIDYKTEDSDTVKALGSFTTALSPQPDSPAFAKAFVDFFVEYTPKLKEKYALELRDQWPALPVAERPPKPGGSSGNDPRLGYVFYDKIGDDLYLAMRESGLASTDFRGDSWIGMHPRLAWVYMTALAEQLAAEHGLRPLTDETRDHMALSGLSNERLAHALLDDVALVDLKPTATEIETTLVSVAFRAVVPKHLDSLSVDKILEFRAKYPNERAKFQSAVADLLKSREWLGSITNSAVLEQRLHDEYDKVWAQNLGELRDKLSDVGIDTVFSAFNLQTALPAGIGGALGAFGAAAVALNPIAAGTAGVALAAVPALRAKRKAAQDILKASPVSFLYRMEQDLEPKDLWERIKQRAGQFALGV